MPSPIQTGILTSVSGTSDLTDAEFVAALEAPTLPNDRFRHYDHVRLAWIYLRDAALPEAADRMAASIRRFALHHHGDLTKYHETITRAFMHLVAVHVAATPQIADFPRFAIANTRLLDKRILLDYYSEERLMSDHARSTWLDPDVRPLPAAKPRCPSD